MKREDQETGRKKDATGTWMCPVAKLGEKKKKKNTNHPAGGTRVRAQPPWWTQDIEEKGKIASRTTKPPTVPGGLTDVFRAAWGKKRSRWTIEHDGMNEKEIQGPLREASDYLTTDHIQEEGSLNLHFAKEGRRRK